jgi:branched-chain amino acid transport system ATP-binding protein
MSKHWPTLHIEQASVVTPLLRVNDLNTFYGHIHCLKDISIDVMEGTLVALIGSNGAGKTTLLRAISGLQSAQGGSIELAGENIVRMPTHLRVMDGIALCPEGRRVFGEMSVEDNIRIGGYLRPRVEVERDLDRIYALFPALTGKKAQASGLLSGGQQQMLAIARALMSKPRLLLLDEPSMGLAPLIVEEVFQVIQRLRQEGMTILLVEQNAHVALPLADWAYVIETGRIVSSGVGVNLMQDPAVVDAYFGGGESAHVYA